MTDSQKVFWEIREGYKLDKYRILSITEVAPGIVIYGDVIPNLNNLHIEIEEDMKNAGLSWDQTKIKGPEGDGVINKEYRDTLGIGVEYFDTKQDDPTDPSEKFFVKYANLFLENFDFIEKDYLSLFHVRATWHEKYSILKYNIGQHFKNHIDDLSLERKISTIYYFNDDYSGGELNFPRFNLSLKPKANQMILFPSTYTYNHSVSPVTDGVRYSLVSWLR